MSQLQEPSRGLNATRIVTSPTVLLLVALTVQIAVGGPVLAASVVRQEVAAEREGFRRFSSTLAMALGTIVAVAPVVGVEPARTWPESEVSVLGSGPREGHAELRLVIQLLDLPPPSVSTAA